MNILRGGLFTDSLRSSASGSPAGGFLLYTNFILEGADAGVNTIVKMAEKSPKQVIICFIITFFVFVEVLGQPHKVGPLMTDCGHSKAQSRDSGSNKQKRTPF